MEVLHKLGIDWKLLLAQGVNFLILLYVLRRFVYKPLLGFLDERAGKIDQGLKDAEAATKRLSEAEAEQKRLLAESQKEARQIVSDALASAKERDAKEREKTEEEMKRILEAAQKQIQEEKDSMLREAKAELASLVALATEKVIQEKVDEAKDAALISKHLS